MAESSRAVPLITTAPRSLAEDVGHRERRYLIQMGIRVVCFAAAVAVDHWTRWVFVVGAVVLPYIAVVLANAGADRQDGEADLAHPRELPAATHPGLESAEETT